MNTHKNKKTNQSTTNFFDDAIVKITKEAEKEEKLREKKLEKEKKAKMRDSKFKDSYNLMTKSLKRKYDIKEMYFDETQSLLLTDENYWYIILQYRDSVLDKEGIFLSKILLWSREEKKFLKTIEASCDFDKGEHANFLGKVGKIHLKEDLILFQVKKRSNHEEKWMYVKSSFKVYSKSLDYLSGPSGEALSKSHIHIEHADLFVHKDKQSNMYIIRYVYENK